MSDYIIVTDSNADLLPEYCKQHNIVEMELTYTLDDKTYRCNDPSLSRHEFYDYMRGGKMPITAQINKFRFWKREIIFFVLCFLPG